MKERNNSFLHRDPNIVSQFPSVTKCDLQGRLGSQILVCDIENTMLRSQCSNFFPYFMLVAFEGGSMLRAFLLLFSCPILWVLNFELKLRVMVFITFCGLRLKDVDFVSRAVLPKFYLENLNLSVYEILASADSKTVFTSLPRVLVERFLKEYLNVDSVKGTELHTIGQYYTGLLANSGLLIKHRAIKEFFGEKRPDIGIGSSSLDYDQQLFISLCKEAYVVNKEDLRRSESTNLPPKKYPKPVVFHDGRLAFLPTPLAILSMFLWLPIGITLAFIRFVIVVFFHWKIASFLITLTGVIRKFEVHKSSSSSSQNGNGVLYVCNHRTLLDPLYLSSALHKPLTAVTYSLSKLCELLSPIRTSRLTRDRRKDSEIIKNLLGGGDLVVCPEGTTCREPYLLRFSSLFAELTDDIVPVAVNMKVSMFYGTTATGFKFLDPIFFAMNPRPFCSIQVLEKLPKEKTMGGGKSSHEVANYIQNQLAEALGFECTNLTRKDKYMMLAGNEGMVPP